jgi:hypothetical protein
MSYFEDEEMLHDEGLCDPEFCRFCEMEGDTDEDDEEEDGA